MAYIFKGTILGALCGECFGTLRQHEGQALFRPHRRTECHRARGRCTQGHLRDPLRRRRRARRKKSSLLGEFATNDAGEFSRRARRQAAMTAGPSRSTSTAKPFPAPTTARAPAAILAHHAPAAWRPGDRARRVLGILPCLPLLVPDPRQVQRLGDLRAGPSSATRGRPWAASRCSPSTSTGCRTIRSEPAVTDASGHFRINYPASAFRKDIFGSSTSRCSAGPISISASRPRPAPRC